MSSNCCSYRPIALLVAVAGMAGIMALVARGDNPPVAKTALPAGALTSRPPSPAPPATRLTAGAGLRTKAGERRRLALPDGSALYVNENSNIELEQPNSLSVRSGEVYVEVAPALDNQKPLVVHAAGASISGRSASFAVRVNKQGPFVGVTRGEVRIGQRAEPVKAGQQFTANEVQPAPRASHSLAWLRDVMCAADAELLPANPQAGGALVAIDPNGQEAKLTLRRFHVDVHIEDGFARTTIDQTYFNHHAQQLEGTFYFPLPPDASLSRLAMYVNGQLMEGGMAERDHARNVYETIRYARRDPALLEWVDGSTFKMRVFPLEPRQEKRIILSYSQRLPSVYGRMSYRFPAGHSLQKVHDWSLEARVKNGAGWTWECSSHALSAHEDKKDLLLFGSARDTATSRDVVLTIADPHHSDPLDEVAEFATEEHEAAKYLLVRYRPKVGTKLTSQRRDWTFLVETSGDRDPLVARVQIEVLRHLLAYAQPDDTFTVLAAGTRVQAFSNAMLPVTPANVNAAVAFLEQAHLIGALDLGQALTEVAERAGLGARSASEGRSSLAFRAPMGAAPTIVHLGSGIPAMGERRDDVLAKRLPEGVTYIGVGVGRRWNRAFMKAAAERTAGHFTQINPDEAIAWRSFELMATINTPRLMAVEVRDQDGKAKFLAFDHAIAHGEEIMAITRIGDELPKSVVVKGTLDGKLFERVLPVRDAKPNALVLPRTWAKLEIDRLLAEDAVKHKDAIVALSKAMYVITPYTSLLVLESEDQYTQYRVDRGRKDHWALYPLPERIPVIVEPDPDARDAAQAKGKRPTREVLKTLVARGAETGNSGRQNALQSLVSGQTPNWTPALTINTPLGFRLDGSHPARIEERLQFQGNGVVLRRAPAPSAFKLGAGFNMDNGLVGTAVLNERELAAARSSLLPPAMELSVPGAVALPTPPPGMPSGGTLFGRSGASRVLAGRNVPAPASGGELMSFVPPPGRRAVGVRATVDGRVRVSPMSRVDVVDTTKSNVLVENVPVLAAGERVRPDPNGTPVRIQVVTLALTPAEMLQVRLAGDSATLSLLPRRPLNLLPLAWFSPLSGMPATETPDGAFRRQAAFLRYVPSTGPVYARPRYTVPDNAFHDIAAYAPGLSTNEADVLGVLETEAVPEAWNRPGHVDAAAREWIDKARRATWHALTLQAEPGQPAFVIHFDGTGRFVYEGVLPFGLRERVVCDGQTFTHLYPQLALGARRGVTRFHRAEFAEMVPWFVPPADELARGADVKTAGERTIAIVPHGVAALPKDEPYYVINLLFADDGRLAERRLAKMPGRETVERLVLSADGTATCLDGNGKELYVQKGKLTAVKAPDLTPDTKDLLVLPLPYRTSAHIRKTLKVEKKPDTELTLKEALPVFLAYVAEGNTNAAQNLFNQVFSAREQRQLGFYVLLASVGANLDSDHGNVLAEHMDHPLAQYLALHTSPVLRKHASQWAVASGSWQDGFLKHLAVTHALLQRWQDPKILKGDPARADAEKRRAIDYVKKQHDSLFGWALVCLIQDRAATDAALHGQLAELWPLFENQPGLRFAARYETARSLWKAGKKDAARERFQALYEMALKDGALPAVDADMRAALQAEDRWGALMRQTAKQLVEQKRRVAVVAIARQCWDLDDQPLAGELLATALDGISDPSERTALSLAAFGFYRETGQLPEADRVLQTLLVDPSLARESLLWRLGHGLAQERDMPARAVECLERALALEAERPPEIIDLQSVRTDYGALLEHYQGLADAMVALKLTPPPDFLSRVIRAADRWRAVDHEPAAACQAAAKVLKRLGERELAWDYLTTPVALQPNEAGPWTNLAGALAKQGELDLADRAFRAAAQAEPTDPQLLWDRAQNLKQLGKRQDAQQLVRRIAEGTWQPRFQGLQSQARHLLDRR
jgi:ferric-dicitrate binding protein FerR (iron transport regulator)